MAVPARLALLLDESATTDWTMDDVRRSKQVLWNTHRECAASLDAFDSTVFRRGLPALFESRGDYSG